MSASPSDTDRFVFFTKCVSFSNWTEDWHGSPSRASAQTVVFGRRAYVRAKCQRRGTLKSLRNLLFAGSAEFVKIQKSSFLVTSFRKKSGSPSATNSFGDTLGDGNAGLQVLTARGPVPLIRVRHSYEAVHRMPLPRFFAIWLGTAHHEIT